MHRNLSRFHSVMKRFKSAKILVVGDLMLDRFIWGTVSRISPEAPVPVLWQKSESFMPGGASNVANNIRALGAEAFMCGMVGDDETGKILVSELAKNGINNEGIIIDSSRPTIEKTRVVAHHQQVVRIDKESNGPADQKIISQILSFAKNRIKDIDAIIIEDYGKGVIVPQLIKDIVALARKHSKIVTVDPKIEHINLYKGTTAITPNRFEAEAATGIKINNIDSLVAAGEKLLKTLSLEVALITLGEDGMALFKKGSWTHIPTVAQEVYDVSGAGDTVIGCFTLARACGASALEAAQLSNVAAGVVVGKVGIAVCSPQELTAHLDQIRKGEIQPKAKHAYPSESLFK